MSGKVKMRCARCSKPFRSSNAKQTLCPECEAKVRAARAAQKMAPKPSVTSIPTAVHKPKIVGAGAHILVPDMAPRPEPAQPPATARDIRAHDGQRQAPTGPGDHSSRE